MLRCNIIRAAAFDSRTSPIREAAVLHQIAIAALPALVIAAGMVATRLPLA